MFRDIEVRIIAVSHSSSLYVVKFYCSLFRLVQRAIIMPTRYQRKVMHTSLIINYVVVYTTVRLTVRL
jgi:hypothetical protein